MVMIRKTIRRMSRRSPPPPDDGERSRPRLCEIGGIFSAFLAAFARVLPLSRFCVLPLASLLLQKARKLLL